MTRFRKGILLAFCFLVIFSAFFAAIRNVSSGVPATAGPMELPVIIIDPGHGGVDGGAVGVGEVVEEHINLAISLTMRDIFVLNGFEVVMTREEDVSIHDEGVTGTRNQKTSDLRNRLAITKEYPNAIFISIHQNKFGISASRGLQVFYGSNHAGSKTLADIVQQNTVDMIQPDNERETKKGGSNLFLIHRAECPAILVECGFLSNAKDAELLQDETFQAQLGFLILRSVTEYLGLGSTVFMPERVV
ncbi:MAG: N-acetylmuramoyl-L-alanine amidase [Oscillospiraceae bacterium]|jgi:N-acetylmuramoyl-L-alanine amidase|nr:N-acetylmuramoyl-L-alanine amidase [Oscillospiraceae bacterium]